MSDFLEDGVEDTRIERLVGLVQKHYDDSTGPLLLSTLGISARNAGIVDKTRSPGTLTSLIKRAGEDRLRLVIPGMDKSRSAVALPSNVDKITRLLTEEKGSERAQRFSELPRPVRVALCVNTEQGERIYLTPKPPFHYEKVSIQGFPAQGSVLVDDQYRLPGVHADSANEEQKSILWRRFQDWADAHSLVATSFLVRRSSTAVSRQTAFERLLAAQSPDVRSRLVLPADIVELLLRHD